MRIGLIDVDGHNFPNLALMKISAYHKSQGNEVEWYTPFSQYDDVYMSKVFSFTPDYSYCMPNVTGNVYKGGTGYDITTTLSEKIDRAQPDYSLYPQIDKRTSYGFLTRGCPNKCKWCIVPKKEGEVKPYMDIDEITLNGTRPYAVLMDNNILASDYGLEQIEKIIKLRYRVDFNQAMDARLVTPDIAKMLAKVKWIKRIRFGCDTPAQVEHCNRAADMISSYGYKGEFFFYCMLHGDINECLNRVNFWKHKGKRFVPHCQPMLDFSRQNQNIPQWQADMARWANRKEIFMTCEFKDYEARKGFFCKEYF